MYSNFSICDSSSLVLIFFHRAYHDAHKGHGTEGDAQRRGNGEQARLQITHVTTDTCHTYQADCVCQIVLHIHSSFLYYVFDLVDFLLCTPGPALWGRA